MKRFVITEEERTHIKGLYEQKVEKPGKLRILQYKDSLESIFTQIQNSMENSPDFCKNVGSISKDLITYLNDLIARMVYDTKMTETQVVEALYNKLDSTIFSAILTIAKTQIEPGTEISKELMDSVSSELRTKYGNAGASLNSVILEIINKIGAKVVPSC